MPRLPDPNAKRRNARVGPVLLPSEGRTGDPPEWPYGTITAMEVQRWRQLWALPQAVAWERLALTLTVARYCRVVLAAERDEVPAVMAQATALEDRLGLNPKAMRVLMWDVAPDEMTGRRDSKDATADARVTDIRSRIRPTG